MYLAFCELLQQTEQIADTSVLFEHFCQNFRTTSSQSWPLVLVILTIKICSFWCPSSVAKHTNAMFVPDSVTRIPAEANSLFGQSPWNTLQRRVVWTCFWSRPHRKCRISANEMMSRCLRSRSTIVEYLWSLLIRHFSTIAIVRSIVTKLWPFTCISGSRQHHVATQTNRIWIMLAAMSVHLSLTMPFMRIQKQRFFDYDLSNWLKYHSMVKSLMCDAEEYR